METLTQEASYYCKKVALHLGRDHMVNDLEAIGIACYDDESDEVLADAFVSSVEAGDIEFDFSHCQAKNRPRHLYLEWLDIDEVWQD